jgi:threonine/homoserine/homoserine lactone efflux protein
MRGRPVRGIIAGFFFGLFLAVTLVLAGVLALNSVVVSLLPFLGVAYGLLMAWLAPFRRRDEPAPLPPRRGPAAR